VCPIGTSDWPYFDGIRRRIFFRNTFAIADPRNLEVPIQTRRTRFSAVFGSRDIFLEFFFIFCIRFAMLILELFTPTL
jgi:hypothetical protein